MVAWKVVSCMKPYRKTDSYTLYLDDAWAVLDSLAENSIDAIVTDPPYEIGFMNKGWDNTGVAFDKQTWQKALRVLKPGGHLLAFNHSRTFHRMAVAIEDAGFEIRDTIMWLYGSGFPKSHDISKAIDRAAGAERKVVGQQFNIANKTVGDSGRYNWNTENTQQKDYINITTAATDEANQWEGWGTALKPAYEPILLARKPIPTTVADNVLQYGTGAINIDGCRVNFVSEEDKKESTTKNQHADFGTKPITNNNVYGDYSMIQPKNFNPPGRFPANVIHDGSEEVVQGFPKTNGEIGRYGRSETDETKAIWGNAKALTTDYGFKDSGSASRFFYTAKTSKKDRDDGLDIEARYTSAAEFRPNHMAKALEGDSGNPYGRWQPKRNIHPTVKPTDLMQYLIRLIAAPNATILDIFMGSGSTGKAAMIENAERDSNYHFIGIDRTAEYLPIAEARIEFGLHYMTEKPKADGVVHKEQIDIFTLL